MRADYRGVEGVRRTSLVPVLCPVLMQLLALVLEVPEVPSPTPDLQRKLRSNTAPPVRGEKWGAGGEPVAQLPSI